MNKYLTLLRSAVISNFKRLSFPYKLTFILTYRCACRCKTCNIWKKEGIQELTLDEVKSFFKISNKFSWINLSGGEIFLRSDLLEIIEVMFENCKNLFLLDFPTSGVNPERIYEDTREILRFRPKKLFVTVSLDGPEKLHNEIRGRDGMWEKSIETFRRLKELKGDNFEVLFGMTLSGYNADMFEQTFTSVKKKIPDIRYSDFHLNIAQISKHYYDNCDMMMGRTEEIIRTIEGYRRRKEKRFLPVSYLENKYQKLIRKFYETSKCPLKCAALSTSCFIDPEWNLYACSMDGREVANLRDYDFDLSRIWSSKEALNLRKEIEEGRCAQCWTPCEAYQTILANLLSA